MLSCIKQRMQEHSLKSLSSFDKSDFVETLDPASIGVGAHHERIIMALFFATKC